MKKTILISLIFFLSSAFADSEIEGERLAQKLGLDAASKAIIQWERVFECQRKMKRYHIDQLSKQEQKILKKYLIDHAIDSDHPTVAGV
ncbi:MAG: hypothetical protein GXO11_06445 [Epsilonproteobacteria bacterium]|nr:hypothetical protein [Campylobacterota bacterium]